MATVKVNSAHMRQFGNVPYGNVTTLAFDLKTIASGAVANSDSATALAIGDVVDLGPLPAGMRLDDASILVLVAMTALVTGSLGFKYEDSVDSAEVPQDAAYFGAGLNLNTAGRLRASTAKFATLPKPARLILTTAGAANAKASDVRVLVTGELIGAK